MKNRAGRRAFALVLSAVLAWNGDVAVSAASYGAADLPVSSGQVVEEAKTFSRIDRLPAASSTAKAGSFQGNRLSGMNAEAYAQMKRQVQAIAEGEEENASFQLQLDVSGFRSSYSAAELGLASFVTEKDGSRTISEEAHRVMTALTGYDRKKLLYAVLRDCPAELYWFGLGYYIGVPYYVGSDDRMHLDGEVQVILTVSEVYKARDGEGNERKYIVDTSRKARVKAALARAAEIVEEAGALPTDREKLRYYYEKIPDLCAYDYEAAAALSGGEAWQIINVFDDDPDTKVICEGYSKAFQYLCDLTDFASPEVRCLCAVGYQTWEGAAALPASTHMWNVVHMDDGKNYLLDITNGNKQPGLFLAECAKGNMDEGYYISVQTLGNPPKTVLYRYIYDDDTKYIYTEEDLRLTGHETTPEQAISGKGETDAKAPGEPSGSGGSTSGKNGSGNTAGKETAKAAAQTGQSDGKATLAVQLKRPSRPVIRSVKRTGAKKARVCWKKVKAAKGYEIQCALNRKFTKGRKTFGAGAKATSKQLKKLKKKKAYYVRVRAYRKVGKTKIYSPWSKVKKIKKK